ncbi:hypothetical protein HanRHA438_Chr05g0240381 [Helianthus annuus]|uniref:Uncharacterized protein n=1 Tax=Helianthus annuus TaxID=4232 RepID=A0A9K3NNT7_HELAN|nr:hypothetical protein HanXRQr2_Chr05g0231111 [Helianthus annuus]KAJ0920353.1 hypothetical protein HanRHA438_Chr05g0240381 [Helianthus annuus]KAJ0923975.1 hypothetical protein HanPSC8_Chr05g0222921 [Helianthus annuus]
MSTATFDGDIIFILVTRRSIISNGRSNSPTMHNGIAPPQGFALSILRSMRMVSIPPLARVSAAAPPAGPPPTTATRRFRPVSLGLDLLARILTRRWWDLGRVVMEVVEWWFSGEEWRRPVKDLRVMEAMVVDCGGVGWGVSEVVWFCKILRIWFEILWWL